MRDVAWRLAGAVAMACLVSPLSAAEQAWRTDGRHVLGELTLDKGRLRFHSTEGEDIPIADLSRVRFGGATVAVSRRRRPARAFARR